MKEETKSYASLKLNAFKLKLANDVSKALGQLVAILLIVAVLEIFIGMLAFALSRILDEVAGSPWGTLSVCAFFLVVLIVLFVFRKRLFYGMFVKIFLEEDDCPGVNSPDDMEERIDSVQRQIAIKEDSYSCGWRNARTCLGYANLALRFIGLMKGKRRASGK